MDGALREGRVSLDEFPDEPPGRSVAGIVLEDLRPHGTGPGGKKELEHLELREADEPIPGLAADLGDFILALAELE